MFTIILKLTLIKSPTSTTIPNIFLINKHTITMEHLITAITEIPRIVSFADVFKIGDGGLDLFIWPGFY